MKVYLLSSYQGDTSYFWGVYSTMKKAQSAGLELGHNGEWFYNSRGQWELDCSVGGHRQHYAIVVQTVDEWAND